MSAPPDGSTAARERCGAALQLAHHGWGRCLFCLHAQPLPDALRAPLAEHAELSQSRRPWLRRRLYSYDYDAVGRGRVPSRARSAPRIRTSSR